MNKVRIPASQIDNYKTFCKAFSRHIEAGTGVRLRGNVLLNAMARAAGHDGHTSLLLDSGVYGSGAFCWELIPTQLSGPLAASLNLESILVLTQLENALLDTPETAGAVVRETESSNLLTGVTPALLPSPAERCETALVATGTDRLEVDLSDGVKSNPEPVISLAVRGMNDEIVTALYATIAYTMRTFGDDQCKNARILGSKNEINRFFHDHPELIERFSANLSLQLPDVSSLPVAPVSDTHSVLSLTQGQTYTFKLPPSRSTLLDALGISYLPL